MSIDKETVTKLRLRASTGWATTQAMGMPRTRMFLGRTPWKRLSPTSRRTVGRSSSRRTTPARSPSYRFEDGLVAVGGDGRGHGAYAVSISDVQDPDEES